VSLTPDAAYREALRLTELQRYRESFPLYQEAIRATRSDTWTMHYNYAAALISLSLLYETREHHQVASTVSSVERVRLMQEATDQLTRAAQLAPAGRARAIVLGRRSNTFAVWGFPWEALISLRQAEQANPGDPTLARQGDALLAMLIDPASVNLVRGGPAPTTEPAPVVKP
jgi:tetratricopeptide (TPR) repeat protein